MTQFLRDTVLMFTAGVLIGWLAHRRNAGFYFSFVLSVVVSIAFLLFRLEYP